jgi:hypothetical protein
MFVLEVMFVTWQVKIKILLFKLFEMILLKLGGNTKIILTVCCKVNIIFEL